MTIKFITITSSRLFRDSLSSCSPIEWAECSEFVDTTLKQGCTNNAFYVAQDFCDHIIWPELKIKLLRIINCKKS